VAIPDTSVPKLSGYGLSTWPTYANATYAAARGYAYRIFVNAGRAPKTATAFHWGVSTWPLYVKATSFTASAYALRIFRNHPTYKP
jgi:hypothetical protein